MTEEPIVTPEGTETNEESPELNLDEVVAVEPDKLSPEQKTFLEENKANLTDEQATKFGIEKEKSEDEQPINLDEVEVETREKSSAKKSKSKTTDDEEIDPDDEATITKVVDKQTADLRKQLQVQTDTFEVDSLIKDHPEYSKYREVALKYMAHPAYKNIPANNIMAIVSAKDQQKIGAQKEREAAKKAKDTQDGGTQTRKPTGQFDWSTASKEDVEAQKAKVLGRQGA